jgi:hypothetical protein
MRATGKRSAVVIARLLATEGFTDHTANQVERYWKEKSGLNRRQQRQISRLEDEISALAKDLSVTQRLALGRFIGLHKKMSFDAGLKIGLQAFAQRMDKLIEGEDGER